MSKSQIATGGIADSAVTVAKTSGVGTTMIQQWRLTSSFTGNADPITSNLAVASADGGAGIGSNMTESSGVFTFPSTGVYLILAHFSFFRAQNDRLIQGHIQADTGSGSGEAGTSYAFCVDGLGDSVYTSTDTQFLFDVTSTTNCKVKFGVLQGNTSNTTQGSTDMNKTCASFLKLGET